MFDRKARAKNPTPIPSPQGGGQPTEFPSQVCVNVTGRSSASATMLGDFRARRPPARTDDTGISDARAVAGAICSVPAAAGATVTFSHHSAEYFEVTASPHATLMMLSGHRGNTMHIPPCANVH